VIGDDVTGELARLREAAATDLETGGALPEQVVSANAYSGHFHCAGITQWRRTSVITGRCRIVACARTSYRAFDWQASDLDRLAMGSLAGQSLNAAAGQAGFSRLGQVRRRGAIWLPVVECSLTEVSCDQTHGTGGLVTPAPSPSRSPTKCTIRLRHTARCRLRTLRRAARGSRQ